jgi:hypothetical protein
VAFVVKVAEEPDDVVTDGAVETDVSVAIPVVWVAVAVVVVVVVAAADIERPTAVVGAVVVGMDVIVSISVSSVMILDEPFPNRISTSYR